MYLDVLVPCHAEKFYALHSSPIFFLLNISIPVASMLFSIRVENSVDPDQTASSAGSSRSGALLFAIQSPKGYKQIREQSKIGVNGGNGK